MTNGKLALLRLAAREFESVSASAEMFISNGYNHEAADADVLALLKEMELIQKKADKILARVEGKIAKFSEIVLSDEIF